MKLTIKRTLSKCIPNFSNNTSRRIILIYHSVGNTPWAISAQAFESQIQWLSKQCEIVSLTQLLTDQESHKKTQVALTFDDGYTCLHDYVAPILKKYQATATVYINTDLIKFDNHTRFLSDTKLGHYPDETFLIWDEVKTLDALGWHIGSHGANHVDLTQLNNERIAHELIYSKNTIEEKLQKECVHFAYTWGRHSSVVRNAVSSAGYQFAVAAHHAPLKSKDDPFALPRLYVDRQFTMADFKAVVMGKWDYLGSIQQITRQVKNILRTC